MFIVIVGEGDEKFSVYYDDYGNAAECALSYREQGLKVEVETKEHWYNLYMEEDKKKQFEERFKLFEECCDIVDRVLEERRAGAYDEQMKIVRKEH